MKTATVKFVMEDGTGTAERLLPQVDEFAYAEDGNLEILPRERVVKKLADYLGTRDEPNITVKSNHMVMSKLDGSCICIEWRD